MAINETSTNERLTIGWFHDGYLLNHYPEIARSFDHRRRLEYIHTAARGLINVTLEAVAATLDVDAPQIHPRIEHDSKGWRRITFGSAASKDMAAAAREALSTTSLSATEYLRVTQHECEGNAATQQLLKTIAETGFRNPLGLLATCPVIAEGTTTSTSPPSERQRIDTETAAAAFALLPGFADVPNLPQI